jgi:SAM-dependent methyltransferase
MTVDPYDDLLGVAEYRARTEARHRADAQHYAGLAINTGGPVLDLACGAGRVLLPITSADIEVVGIDRSLAMLRETQQQAMATSVDPPRLVCSDMRAFALGPWKARLAIIACRSIALLLDEEDLSRTFRCVRNHLLPGSRLAFDTFDPSDVPPTGQLRVASPLALEGGGVVERQKRASWDDLRNRILLLEVRYEWRRVDGAVLRRFDSRQRVRYWTEDELTSLLRNAGFAALTVNTNFPGADPAISSDRSLVVEAA